MTRPEVFALLGLSSTGAERLPDGYHSEVSSITDQSDGRRKVLKVIGGKMRTPMTAAQAAELCSDIIAYRNKLEQAGIRIPPLDGISILENRELGGYEVIEVSGFRGRSLEQEVRASDDEQAVALFCEIVHAIRPVLAERVGIHDLKVGIDPKPANFTRDEGGALWYVDTMPPRHRKRGIPIIECTPPKTEMAYKVGYFRHFTVHGVLTVLLTQVSRLHPRSHAKIKEAAVGFAREFFPDSVPQLNDSTVHRIVHGRELEILQGMSAMDMYTLREIACQLAGQRPELTKGWLEELYGHTHFDIEEGVPEGSLRQAKQMLHEALLQQQ